MQRRCAIEVVVASSIVVGAGRYRRLRSIWSTAAIASSPGWKRAKSTTVRTAEVYRSPTALDHIVGLESGTPHDDSPTNCTVRQRDLGRFVGGVVGAMQAAVYPDSTPSG